MKTKRHRVTSFLTINLKGELQRENEFIWNEKAFKMLENDMYISGIGEAVPELLESLRFKGWFTCIRLPIGILRPINGLIFIKT